MKKTSQTMTSFKIWTFLEAGLFLGINHTVLHIDNEIVYGILAVFALAALAFVNMNNAFAELYAIAEEFVDDHKEEIQSMNQNQLAQFVSSHSGNDPLVSRSFIFFVGMVIQNGAK